MKVQVQKRTKKISVLNPVDFVFPDHLHNAIEMIYLEEGSLQLRILDKRIDMHAGDFAIVFPNLIHGFYTANPEEPPSNRLILSIVPLSFCSSFQHTLVEKVPDNPCILSEHLHPNITYAIRELSKESYREQSESVYTALVHLILSRYMQSVSLHKLSKPENHSLTEQTLKYIAAHFQENISLTDLSREMCVSKYYLSHLFTEKINTHFRHYLNTIRADYAAQQIRTTDLPITQIWADAGFDSQRTFNRVFLELYHMTPSQYRNKR